ncbi:sugar ABC transporter ATP-binding protein [bacterium]|nr:sugar ABC transporter ATP-binding protein [bacterium]
MADVPLLEMKHIGKAFPGVQALRDVSFDLHKGEVVGLVGENGAGKSTLMKIVSGVHAPDEGEILINGKSLRFSSPKDAESAGVAVIYQELSLVPSLSVMENVLMAREPRTRWKTIDWRKMAETATELLTMMEMPIDVRRPVEEFGVAVQQMIEIAKALSLNARILVMDEPTSSLSEQETKRLFGIVRRLKNRGVGIVYISHKLEEIYEIADRIAVLRDGLHVGTAPANELPAEKMIQWMVGRKIDQFFPSREHRIGEELFRVSSLTLPDPQKQGVALVDNVSFSLRAGEILGLAGLRGAGNSELLGAIFGRFGGLPRGEIFIKGKKVNIVSPPQAIANGMAYLTNDRKASGLILPMSVMHNMTIVSLKQMTRFGWLHPLLEQRTCSPFLDSLGVRTPSLRSEVSTLSGGNQQKVILVKWLMSRPNILLLDEPTRGIDVGAKAEIYSLMNNWASEGKGILLITSELPELLAMSDRILVMHRGKITAEFTDKEATQENVMAAAM